MAQLPGRDPPRCLGDRELDQLARIWPRLRRGHAEGAVGRVGGLLQDDVPRPARPRLVGPQHVLELDHVGGGLDLVEVERGDPVDVLEDSRELRRHPLELLLGEPQAGKPRDVQHLFPLDHALSLGRCDGARACRQTDHRPAGQVVGQHLGVYAFAPYGFRHVRVEFPAIWGGGLHRRRPCRASARGCGRCCFRRTRRGRR